MNKNHQKEYHNTWVIGDIHGANLALLQCMERSGFDKENDLIISLGDICDGWPDTFDTFETMLSFGNLEMILGNHDFWALQWMTTGRQNESWLKQGGHATIKSYSNKVPTRHIKLLTKAKPYLILKNKLFVHGGFDINRKLELQNIEDFIWDRSLVKMAMKHKIDDKHLTNFDEIFVGHTPTLNFGLNSPIKACEVWLMDTGAGWAGGKLSLMNVYTGQVFQSDLVNNLYPGSYGRNKFVP